MNGYVWNCLRRAKMSLARKVWLWLRAMLNPSAVELAWSKHCWKMQRELDESRR